MTAMRQHSTALFVALLLAAGLASGCSSGGAASKGKGWSFSNLLGGKDSASTHPAAKAQVLYAAEAGVNVLREASSSAKVVGELTLHQKVLRSRVSGSYSYIKAADGALQGWVPSSKLLGRLPAKAGAEAGSPSTPQQGDAADAVPEEVSVPEDEVQAAPEAPAPAQAEAASAPTSGGPPPPPAGPALPASPPPAAKPAKGVMPSVFDPY